ncbi:MAG: hypothetical protein U5L96_08870 [Owenweeksia sp.]|nr:hypothetical protein [Owenweeksia sp.]
MRILRIGLGSIGKRHLSILKEIEDVEVAALRTSKGTLKEPEEGVKEFHRLEEALDFAPDGVIVSNPTSLHIESALPFLKEGIEFESKACSSIRH